MANKNQILPSEVAKALGSVKTPKKSAQSALNVARSSANKPRPLSEIACTCGRCPDEYAVGVKAGAADCLRAKAIRARNYRARKKSESPT